MKILMIGAGNMGLTFAEGMMQSDYLKHEKMMIYDKSQQVKEDLSENENFSVVHDLPEAIQEADIIFIAVKPYHAEELFNEIKPYLHAEQLLVSLMAGVTLDYMQQSTGIQKIIRAMPNLPAKVSKGVTAFTETEAVSKIEKDFISSLLESTGVSLYVEDEHFINKSTGISGSGPAYVFYFMQSMMEAAIKMGFSEEDSKTLVVNTFEGAVELFKESDIAAESWIEKVASKGGTTEAAIDSMKDNNVKSKIKEAAYKAFEKAVELGEDNG